MMAVRKLTRKELLIYLAASVMMGICLGIVALTGTWHPRPWPETVAAVVFLLTACSWAPAWVLLERDRQYWAAIPDCDRCGRKMAPAQVRISWRHRLRYYRCECARDNENPSS